MAAVKARVRQAHPEIVSLVIKPQSAAQFAAALPTHEEGVGGLRVRTRAGSRASLEGGARSASRTLRLASWVAQRLQGRAQARASGTTAEASMACSSVSTRCSFRHPRDAAQVRAVEHLEQDGSRRGIPPPRQRHRRVPPHVLDGIAQGGHEGHARLLARERAQGVDGRLAHPRVLAAGQLDQRRLRGRVADRAQRPDRIDLRLRIRVRAVGAESLAACSRAGTARRSPRRPRARAR